MYAIIGGVHLVLFDNVRGTDQRWYEIVGGTHQVLYGNAVAVHQVFMKI